MGMKTNQCVKCGWCCTVSACGYGKWNPDKEQCDFLNPDSTCGKISEIIEKEKNSPFPMIGCGCSSPLCNARREAKMRELGMNPEAEQAEIEKEFGIDLDFSPDFAMLWEKMQETI